MVLLKVSNWNDLVFNAYFNVVQVGRRSEEFSEAQHVMRESITQRRDLVLADDGRESTTPVEQTSCGLGGELRYSEKIVHGNTDTCLLYSKQESIIKDEDKDNTDIDEIDIMVIYNTRL